ncbi:hypothetical protein PCANC_22145 [Puccinia coronata f. sp. avenae]|uniref:Uncharacterized protein n=1 Tax=Puccinia coronata f. sp. avenae TaxID=200324 RepID=A0A2N5U9Y8_9BASI|nr:hypothetical protein PCANC_22145 [Puccinia coronata f. sp. avenae]PLW34550.1 hypothetical protein PCASD_12916 [Puccinia coronata f. sp. avenae]
MVFEVQSFFCLDGNKPVGLCGKGKNKDGSYKRVFKAFDNSNTLNFSCRPARGEKEAGYCCPRGSTGASDLPKCDPLF